MGFTIYLQNVHFHFEHIFLCVCVIGNVDKVFHLWRIQFLVFGCDKQGSDTD